MSALSDSADGSTLCGFGSVEVDTDAMRCAAVGDDRASYWLLLLGVGGSNVNRGCELSVLLGLEREKEPGRRGVGW